MQNNIGLFLAKRAALSPNVEAYVCVDPPLRLTFRELNARCNRIAHALAQLGVAKGDRVAILMMNSASYMEIFFAIAKIGAVAVPLNWRLVPDELAFILNDSGATTLLFDGEFAEVATDLHARVEPTDVRDWIAVGSAAESLDFGHDYEALCCDASADEPTIAATDGDDLYIMYTSGTTGRPKGAVHTHSTAMWACLTINATADMRYGDRYIVALPLFHVGALTPMTANVLRGITSVVMRAFDPVSVWQLIEAEKVTVLLAVPAMLNFMLQESVYKQTDYSRLRWIMSGASPVPVTLIHDYNELGIEIHQVYGLTESCGPACLISPEDAIRKAGSTGKAFFHTDVRVVDVNGDDVTGDEVGEVIMRGAHIMKGYWNLPEATAGAIRDGWLYSGDLATIDAEGFVFIHDRKKDMIISGGENVYPAEIEDVILKHPGVREVAVIGQPSVKWGESPLAVVVKSDDRLTADDILGHCRGKLAGFKIPTTVEFVDEIPRNPSGKVLKRLLRERYPGDTSA